MIIVLTGPTGVGKTKLSLALAKHYQTDIISGDSMQIYQGMDIGTAKVSAEDQAQIKHHMIDILPPQEPYSVANFQRDVRAKINALQKENKKPFIVGGTGFYIKSVLHDFEFDDTKRDFTLEAQYQAYDNESLYQKLQTLDAKTAKKLHPNNRKRILQALSQAKKGQPISEKTNQSQPLYDYIVIVLTLQREKLYETIEKRVDTMFAQGLVKEAQNLYKQNLSYTAKQAIGYQELFAHFDGDYDLKEAKTRIKRNTRRYAKRQLTYFKHQFNAEIIDTTKMDFQALLKKSQSLIDQALKDARDKP